MAGSGMAVKEKSSKREQKVNKCPGAWTSNRHTLGSPPRGRGVPAAPRVGGSTLQEAFSAQAADPSAVAFVLCALGRERRPVMWVQDRASRRWNGRLHAAGLGGMHPEGAILRVEVGHPRDVLWAMEEGAASAALSAVVGEIHGAPRVLDFRATKRLALRAKASGVPVWLIRSGDGGGLSAARERWRLRAAPSEAHPFDARAPGHALWEADLFRAWGRPPGRWIASHEPGAADRLRLLPPLGGGAPAGEDEPRPHAARR